MRRKDGFGGIKVPKFYILSDVHGFYKEMREALDRAGFDPNDDNSWLISLGDEMDRGPEPEGVINYIMNLPRAIWVKGNHQTLMEDLITRGYPRSHDWHNGTMQSVLSLAPNAKIQSDTFAIAYEKTKPFFDKAVNYFELDKYILVHSFVPLVNEDGLPTYYTRNKNFSFNPDWRNASDEEWRDAMWGNPFDLAMKGLNQTGKILIFGHFHCSYPRSILNGESEFGDDADFSIYYGNGYIGIDACTAYSDRVNCLVIEDNFKEG